MTQPPFIMRAVRAAIAFVVGLVLFAVVIAGVLPMITPAAVPVVFTAAAAPAVGLIVGFIEDRRDWWGAGALVVGLTGLGVVEAVFPLVERSNGGQAADNAVTATLSVVSFLLGVGAAKLAIVLVGRSVAPREPVAPA